jgi:predicted ATP-grasp superfamily ATP-dependent carboligase
MRGPAHERQIDAVSSPPLAGRRRPRYGWHRFRFEFRSCSQLRGGKVRAVRPPAIVLGLGVNGLSVARALAAEGVDVHGVWTGSGEPGRFSRSCRAVAAGPIASGERSFIDWLARYATGLDRPVVLPTSDRFALWLARNRDRLDPVCRSWANGAGVLETLLSKDRFHALLTAASLRSPPTLIEPSPAELREWCAVHPGPYLIKPFHENALPNPLGAKNRVVPTAEALDGESARRGGLRGLLVQRMIQGGDGWHYTVAGLCDRTGALRGLVTKRKLIQYPPDSGIVARACLPSCHGDEEEVLLDAARAVLRTVPYHGLFGCEWVKDRESGEIFALDFNPRSLYGNSHILAAGVNLPYLAYRDLCAEDLADVPERPRVRSVLWTDAWGCAGAWSRLRRSNTFPLLALLRVLRHTDAWALWTWRDPLPAAAHAAMQLTRASRARRTRRGRATGRREATATEGS